MEDKIQAEEGVSLLDIVRLLLSKIKLLILVLLIGGILGGAFAVWKTMDVDYWGTNVEFYVNPEKPEESTGTSGVTSSGSQYGVYGAYGEHVMDNMVRLLSSESFAEQLILNGMLLPEKDTWVSDAEEKKDGLNTKLNAAIDEADGLLKKVEVQEAEYNAALAAKTETVDRLSDAKTVLSKLWKNLYNQGKVQESTFNEKEYFALSNRSEELIKAYEACVAAQEELETDQEIVSTKEEALNKAQKEAKAPMETALDYWRMTEKYTQTLSKYKDALTFSFQQDTEDSENANSLARSFIYVKISVLNDKEFAENLLEQIKIVVPEYVSANMTVPTGYSGTNCQRITRTDNIRLTNPGYTVSEAIKYAILLAAAAFIVAAIVIIVIDRSDKRLRDYEVITRQFNVPVLGVVPTIEELEAQSDAKKKASDKTNTEVK